MHKLPSDIVLHGYGLRTKIIIIIITVGNSFANFVENCLTFLAKFHSRVHKTA